MRDDLFDAQAAVDWAVAQIPLLQNKLVGWNATRPYEISVEPDAETGGKNLVASLVRPLDPTINAEVGVIINSTRTALDLLAASLARRNGKKPDRGTHFPIFSSEQCMIDPLHGIEGKKWLSQRERVAIKALKPHNGGDDTIWPLHQLDILRKHERLVFARPDVRGFRYETGSPREGKGYVLIGGHRGIERSENKTILAGFFGPVTQALDMAKGYADVTAHIVFNEADLGIVDEEVTAKLTRFVARVSEIMTILDDP